MSEIKYNLTWFTSDTVKEDHKELRTNQVSCWILTSDKKFVLVSKNGEKWTIPAGHPETFDKDLIESTVREVMEETGLDISEQKENLKMVGYYVVEDINAETNEIVDKYLQRRFILEIGKNASELALRPKEGDTVRYVGTFNAEESLERVKWMRNSNDFIELNKTYNLVNLG